MDVEHRSGGYFDSDVNSNRIFIDRAATIRQWCVAVIAGMALSASTCE